MLSHFAAASSRGSWRWEAALSGGDSCARRNGRARRPGLRVASHRGASTATTAPATTASPSPRPARTLSTSRPRWTTSPAAATAAPSPLPRQRAPARQRPRPPPRDGGLRELARRVAPPPHATEERARGRRARPHPAPGASHHPTSTCPTTSRVGAPSPTSAGPQQRLVLEADTKTWHDNPSSRGRRRAPALLEAHRERVLRVIWAQAIARPAPTLAAPCGERALR